MSSAVVDGAAQGRQPIWHLHKGDDPRSSCEAAAVAEVRYLFGAPTLAAGPWEPGFPDGTEAADSQSPSVTTEVGGHPDRPRRVQGEQPAHSREMSLMTTRLQPYS